MRGRTNIVQRLGAIVNGEVITAEVYGSEISTGDFVSIEYALEEVKMFTEPKSFQKVVKIDNYNLYLIINQESSSNLAIYLYEYENNKLNLLDYKITSFFTYKNFCYLDNNYFLILADTSGVVFNVDYVNKKINFIENSESIINYNQCFLIKKNGIDYLIIGSFSTNSYKFNYYIYSVENGVLTKLNTSAKSLTLISYTFKNWAEQFAKSVNFNKALFSFIYTSSSSSTKYETLKSYTLNDSLELTEDNSKEIYSSSTANGIVNKIIVNNNYLLLVNNKDNRIEFYDGDLNVISTISYLSYFANVNKIVNYYENKCIIYYNSKFYVLELNENEMSIKISNFIEFNPDGYTTSIDGVLLNSNGVKDDIFIFHSYGYKLISYEDGILFNGIKELSNKVTKYNGRAIGFAKTGGSEGQMIQVYVPLEED